MSRDETGVVATVSNTDDCGPGDLVEAAVTHQIQIGRESAWVKAGIKTVVRQGETGDEAGERAIRYVNTQVINGIMKAVKTVNDFESGR